MLAKAAAETLAEKLANTDDAMMTEEEILTFLDGNEGRAEIEHALE